MKTLKEIEKEIENCKIQLNEGELTNSEAQFYKENKIELNKLQALLQQNKEIVKLIDKWWENMLSCRSSILDKQAQTGSTDNKLTGSKSKFYKDIEIKLQQLKSSIIGSEEKRNEKYIREMVKQEIKFKRKSLWQFIITGEWLK